MHLLFGPQFVPQCNSDPTMSPCNVAGYTIRKATVADAPVLADHNQAMALETEDLHLARTTIHQGVEAILSDDTKGRYYVVMEDNLASNQPNANQPVAQLMITYEWSDWRNANVWWIQSVYVQPAHRRKGLFRALYAHVRQEATEAGAAGLRLYADNDNSNAHSTV